MLDRHQISKPAPAAPCTARHRSMIFSEGETEQPIDATANSVIVESKNRLYPI
jgi:hypothetical protein